MTENVSTEADRFQVLRDLDTGEFDASSELKDLCDLIARFFGLPIAFVSLLDKDTQWIKATHGADIGHIPRSSSICDHTIRSGNVLVIPDLLQDARFASNAFVSSSGIRFYAGAPLEVGEGIRLGSVCVADTEARSFSTEDESVLEQFARVATGLLREHGSRVKAERAVVTSEHRRKELQQRSQELWRQHRMMKQTERIAHVGGWEFEPESATAIWSEEVYRIAGRPFGERITLEKVLSLFPVDQAGRLADALERTRRSEGPFDIELQLVQGSNRWVRITGELDDTEDSAPRVFGVVQDISEHRASQERLWHLANHDPLTGLPNRAQFGELFAAATKQADRDECGLAVLFLDLDNFKNVNDTLGHDVGDDFLVEAGNRIRQHLRPGDFVGRLGGDEFAVVLKDVADTAAAQSIGERLLDAIAAPYKNLGPNLSPSVSIGIALYGEGDAADKVIQNADIALYAAKSAGKSRLHLYQSEQRDTLEHKLELVSRFKNALETGAIEAHYQPQYSVLTDRLCGFEALVRWRWPDGSIRTPGDFSQALEDSGAAIDLGRFMLSAAAEQLHAWIKDGLPPLKIAVNVGGPELKRGDYARKVLDILARHKVPPHLLQVEITESVLLFSDRTDVGPTLEVLAANGIAIALDDFGTGFASLTHLKKYPIHTIKIDRSFIADLSENADDLTIVKSMIDLANNLDIKTIAEGVETASQLQCLSQLGCTYAQGFYYSRAVPADKATQLLKTDAGIPSQVHRHRK